MGRLGSREMTAASDLDLILLYDFDPEHPDSDGARSLQGSHYFARLTQRLLVLGGTKTPNLRALADALRDLQPGQTVEVEFAREVATLRSTLRLGER